MAFTDKVKNLFKNADKTSRTKSANKKPAPLIISRTDHPISRKDISPNALKVLYRLRDAGYEAYLVGGGVRDLLLDKRPKDFDIATNAHPNKVHKLFSNALLIGRRFRLVHVRFGREIIEVATFRANHPSSSSGNHSQAAGGMLTRDNVYGTVADDALRRDFTINALYYTIEDFSIRDFSSGIEDMQKRVIRILGDPTERYREDPVRMLRALRFCAKLDFTLAEDTAAPIKQLGHLLKPVPGARMFDEMLKLLMSGWGEATYPLLQAHDLFRYIYPQTHKAISQAETHRSLHDDAPNNIDHFIICALRNSDNRIRAGKTTTPAFLLAVLLWHPFKNTLSKINNMPIMPAIHEAGNQVVAQQLATMMIPKRFNSGIRVIWEMQWRLTSRTPQRAYALLQNKRFRAGYDFLLLREEAGEDCQGLGQWWTQFQFADADKQARMLKEVNSLPKKTSQAKHKPVASPLK